MENNKIHNEQTAEDIINNNYAVQQYFDNVPEGIFIEMYLSMDKAKEVLSKTKRTHFTSYGIVHKLAIIGVVPFNDGVAYVFNKELPQSDATDHRIVTAETFERLMDCYVFTSQFISAELLDRLVDEYKRRGGMVYEDYHSFDRIELRKVRKKRRREYRDRIVFESIFKHGFREVGKQKWSNGDVIIREKQMQRSSTKYPAVKHHTKLEVPIYRMMLIGSIFGRYTIGINQLNDNLFGIVCNKENSSKYHFTYFEIEFKK